MSAAVNTREIPIITIPCYVWKTLNAKGFNITTMDNLVTQVNNGMEQIRLNVFKNKEDYVYDSPAASKLFDAKLIESLTNTLSDSDLQDMVYADWLVFHKLTNINKYLNPITDIIIMNSSKYSEFKELNILPYHIEKYFIEFINLLTDDDIGKFKSFILSIKTPGSQNDFFEIITGENGIFIILNTGFTNYTILSSEEQNKFKLQFLKVLYNKIYSAYGEKFANSRYRLLEELHKLLLITY